MAPIPSVIILGGGLAGLAAAVPLAESGYDVEVLEKRPTLGGRASSFLPPGGAEPIDNCQHVLLGCCTNLLDFFRRTGTLDRFRFYSRFLFLGPHGLSPVSASALPAPFHLLPSLLRFRDLTWADRWAIARAMLAILRRGEPPAEETMLDWLRRQRQTPRAIEHFWRVVLTSALNEDLERAPCRHGLQVFWEAFLRNRQGYRMGVPATPLDELYSSELLSKRCRLSLGAMAARLEVSDSRVAVLHLQNGEQRSADFFVSAVPPDALVNLLPEEVLRRWRDLPAVAQMDWSPITGIHLWFDRPITELQHAAILGRTIQWIFNRTAIGGKSGAADGYYIQLVISASRSLMTLRRDEIIALALRELEELFPNAKGAKLLKAVVVKEAESTLSFPPGSDALRPGPDTPLKNLFLAGDWTSTGWPPTMEGAVRSGYRAAEKITAASGNPHQFLQPDLQTAPLVRFLKRF